MNLRHRYAVITIRTLFGLFIIFSGVSGLMASQSMEGIPEPMIQTMQVLKSTGLLYMIKITETIAGLMLITGFLPALAAIFLAPIAIGIIVVNANVAPNYIISGVIVSLLDIYLGYAYWDKYKALFERK